MDYLEISKADFDLAVEAVKTVCPSKRTCVCVLAQAIIRQIGPVFSSGWELVRLTDKRRVKVIGSRDIVSVFDRATQTDNLPLLTELRESLPVSFPYVFQL